MGIEAWALLLIALVAGAGRLALWRVPEGQVHTVRRAGKFVGVLQPGLHLVLPGFRRIIHRVNLLGHRVTLEETGCVHRADVYFQILEPVRAGSHLDDIESVVAAAVRDRLAVIGATEHAGGATTAAARLKQDLNQRLLALGLRVTRCQLI